MDKNKVAVSLFNKMAVIYQEKFMDVSLYSKILDLFCNTVKKHNAEILELACGPGNITRYLLNKRADFKITGTDLAPNMIDLAKLNNPEAEFKLMDCRSIGAIEKKYDAIMCGFCLPYLCKEDTETLIHDAYNILHPKGVLYLSTMEDDYEKSRIRNASSGDEVFIHYYKSDYLIEILEQNNFKILSLERLNYQANRETVIDIIIIAEK